MPFFRPSFSNKKSWHWVCVWARDFHDTTSSLKILGATAAKTSAEGYWPWEFDLCHGRNVPPVSPVDGITNKNQKRGLKMVSKKFTTDPWNKPQKSPKYKYERISFINRQLRVWGMFQGSVGVFLDGWNKSIQIISIGFIICLIANWWLNQPFSKICHRQIGIFPKDRGEH